MIDSSSGRQITRREALKKMGVAAVGVAWSVSGLNAAENLDMTDPQKMKVIA